MGNVVFTKEQQAVIDAPIEDILVSAAAGSGKTTVLVRRIIEKRTCQEYWRTREGRADNGDRHRMRRHVTNQFKNLYLKIINGTSTH